MSSWTQTVLLDRIASGNFNHSSVLVALGEKHPEPPGYPPLIFQLHMVLQLGIIQKLVKQFILIVNEGLYFGAKMDSFES